MFEPFACTCQEQSVSFILQAASKVRLARVRRGAKRSVIDGQHESHKTWGQPTLAVGNPAWFARARLANMGHSVN